MAPSAMAGAGLIDPEFYLDVLRNTFDIELSECLPAIS